MRLSPCPSSIPGQGYFVPATIIDTPPGQARVVQEEAVGPVMPLIRSSDGDDAIARANACEYGLGGSVWSMDMDRARVVAAPMETGTVWIDSAQGLSPYAAFAGRKQWAGGVRTASTAGCNSRRPSASISRQVPDAAC
ncbi:MAG: aldehyde dehydrogenase family protein [Novosphingobium sp.]